MLSEAVYDPCITVSASRGIQIKKSWVPQIKITVQGLGLGEAVAFTDQSPHACELGNLGREEQELVSLVDIGGLLS